MTDIIFTSTFYVTSHTYFNDINTEVDGIKPLNENEFIRIGTT